MNPGMNAVTKADIVGEFVQFSIHCKPGTCIRHQSLSGVRRHHRILYRIVAIEEELQDGDTGPGYGTVSGWISWMRRRSLWKSLRQQVTRVTGGCVAGL